MKKLLSLFALAILFAGQPIASITNNHTAYAAGADMVNENCAVQTIGKKCASVLDGSGQTAEEAPRKQVSGVSGSKDVFVKKKKLAAIIESKQLWIKQKRVSEAVK